MTKLEPINIGKSTLTRFLLIVKKPIINGNIPNPRNILVIFDPTTSPITISEDPAKTAKIAVSNSGKDVPTDTIVAPIIKAGIPRDNPISSADPEKRPAALINAMRLTVRIDSHKISCIRFLEEFNFK